MSKDIVLYVEDSSIVVDDVSKCDEEDVIIEFDCLLHTTEYMKINKLFSELFLNKEFSDLVLTDFVKTKIGFLYTDIIENIDTFIQVIDIDDIHFLSASSFKKLEILYKDISFTFEFIKNYLIDDDRVCFVELFEEFLKTSDKEEKKEIAEIFNKYIGA